jgi:hypothetical protein
VWKTACATGWQMFPVSEADKKARRTKHALLLLSERVAYDATRHAHEHTAGIVGAPKTAIDATMHTRMWRGQI